MGTRLSDVGLMATIPSRTYCIGWVVTDRSFHRNFWDGNGVSWIKIGTRSNRWIAKPMRGRRSNTLVFGLRASWKFDRVRSPGWRAVVTMMRKCPRWDRPGDWGRHRKMRSVVDVLSWNFLVRVVDSMV